MMFSRIYHGGTEEAISKGDAETDNDHVDVAGLLKISKSVLPFQQATGLFNKNPGEFTAGILEVDNLWKITWCRCKV